MYICIHMYIYIYIYIYVCVYIHMYTWTFIFMCTLRIAQSSRRSAIDRPCPRHPTHLQSALMHHSVEIWCLWCFCRDYPSYLDSFWHRWWSRAGIGEWHMALIWVYRWGSATSLPQRRHRLRPCDRSCLACAVWCRWKSNFVLKQYQSRLQDCYSRSDCIAMHHPLWTPCAVQKTGPGRASGNSLAIRCIGRSTFNQMLIHAIWLTWCNHWVTSLSCVATQWCNSVMQLSETFLSNLVSHRPEQYIDSRIPYLW